MSAEGIEVNYTEPSEVADQVVRGVRAGEEGDGAGEKGDGGGGGDAPEVLEGEGGAVPEAGRGGGVVELHGGGEEGDLAGDVDEGGRAVGTGAGCGWERDADGLRVGANVGGRPVRARLNVQAAPAGARAPVDGGGEQHVDAGWR